MDVMKPGSRLKDEGTGVQAIVVKSSPETAIEIRPGSAVALGKRYTCEACSAEALITQGGSGELTCHGAPMRLAEAKLLPSSD